MPGRGYTFYPENSDKETLKEIIKHCGTGDHLQHEINTLQNQVKWIAEYLLRKENTLLNEDD